MLMVRVCSYGKWAGYRIKKYGHLDPLSAKQLTCIAVKDLFQKKSQLNVGVLKVDLMLVEQHQNGYLKVHQRER